MGILEFAVRSSARMIHRFLFFFPFHLERVILTNEKRRTLFCKHGLWWVQRGGTLGKNTGKVRVFFLVFLPFCERARTEKKKKNKTKKTKMKYCVIPSVVLSLSTLSRLLFRAESVWLRACRIPPRTATRDQMLIKYQRIICVIAPR